MTFTDLNFINALKEELQKRNYSFIEEIRTIDSSDNFYKVFSITDNEPRVMKVFEEPITNFRENKHLVIIKQLSKYHDEKIVKTYETGYIENY